MIPEIDSLHFDWIRWRNGSPVDLGILCQKESLITNKKILNKYAIGWCKAENLICRPKIDNKAVMFVVNEICFWFHLTNYEFGRIFDET